MPGRESLAVQHGKEQKKKGVREVARQLLERLETGAKSKKNTTDDWLSRYHLCSFVPGLRRMELQPTSVLIFPCHVVPLLILRDATCQDVLNCDLCDLVIGVGTVIVGIVALLPPNKLPRPKRATCWRVTAFGSQIEMEYFFVFIYIGIICRLFTTFHTPFQ